MSGNKRKSRRQFLQATGAASLVSVAGCLESGAPDNDESSEDEEDGEPDLGSANMPAIPESQEECVSIGGEKRNPAGVSPKESVNYQYYPNFGGGDDPQGSDAHSSENVQMCANCRYYCPPKAEDGNAGACALVDGSISSQHWCAVWAPVEESS